MTYILLLNLKTLITNLFDKRTEEAVIPAPAAIYRAHDGILRDLS